MHIELLTTLSSGSTVIRVTANGSDNGWVTTGGSEGTPDRWVPVSEMTVATTLGDVITSKRETFRRTGSCTTGTSGREIGSGAGSGAGVGAAVGRGSTEVVANFALCRISLFLNSAHKRLMILARLQKRRCDTWRHIKVQC